MFGSDGTKIEKLAKPQTTSPPSSYEHRQCDRMMKAPEEPCLAPPEHETITTAGGSTIEMSWTKAVCPPGKGQLEEQQHHAYPKLLELSLRGGGSAAVGGTAAASEENNEEPCLLERSECEALARVLRTVVSTTSSVQSLTLTGFTIRDKDGITRIVDALLAENQTTSAAAVFLVSTGIFAIATDPVGCGCGGCSSLEQQQQPLSPYTENAPLY